MTWDKLNAWTQASRPPFFVATIIPIAIGWIMAGAGRAFAALVAFWVVIYLSILLMSVFGPLSWLSLLALLTLPIFARMIGLVRRTADWQDLHGQGRYVRMLYFFCGVAIILGLL